MRYWFDTEFIERGPEYPIKLLSIGIVAEDGRELYLEHPCAAELIVDDYREHGDPWLSENVMPHLRGGNGDVDLRAEILAFCDDRPEFWAYFADYDWVVLCQIFGQMTDLPSGWPMYCCDLKQEMDRLGISRDGLPKQDGEHYALNDARWTKQAWAYLQKDGSKRP